MVADILTKAVTIFLRTQCSSLRRQCINQNEAESVTLCYSLYIYLTNPHGLYVISPNVILALPSLHCIIQVLLLYVLHHMDIIENECHRK